MTGQEQEQNNETRASKRICLSVEPSGQDLRQSLMAAISLLLGRDRTESLTNLHAAIR